MEVEVRYIVGTARTPASDAVLSRWRSATSTFERAWEARLAIDAESRRVEVVVGEQLADIAPQNFAAWASAHPAVHRVIAWGWEPGGDLAAMGVQPMKHIRMPDDPRIKLPDADAESSAASGRGDGSVIVVASGGGGTGKSTFASLAACLAARSAVDTALVDFDLGFGELAFVFDRVADHTLVDVVERIERRESVSRLGERVLPHLTLFASPDRPELGEKVAPHASTVIRAIRSEFRLTVVDTGPCWAESHADLFEAADRVVLLVDPTPVGVRAAARAWKLLHRLRIPEARVVVSLNRWREESGVTPMDVAAALRVGMVRPIPDGASAISQAFGIGRPGSLIDARNRVVAGIQETLADELPALGIEFENSVPELFGAVRRKRW